MQCFCCAPWDNSIDMLIDLYSYMCMDNSHCPVTIIFHHQSIIQHVLLLYFSRIPHRPPVLLLYPPLRKMCSEPDLRRYDLFCIISKFLYDVATFILHVLCTVLSTSFYMCVTSESLLAIQAGCLNFWLLTPFLFAQKAKACFKFLVA